MYFIMFFICFSYLINVLSPVYIYFFTNKESYKFNYFHIDRDIEPIETIGYWGTKGIYFKSKRKLMDKTVRLSKPEYIRRILNENLKLFIIWTILWTLLYLWTKDTLALFLLSISVVFILITLIETFLFSYLDGKKK